MAAAQAAQGSSSGGQQESSKKLPPPSPLRSILAGSLAGGIEICEFLLFPRDKLVGFSVFANNLPSSHYISSRMYVFPPTRAHPRPGVQALRMMNMDNAILLASECKT